MKDFQNSRQCIYRFCSVLFLIFAILGCETDGVIDSTAEDLNPESLEASDFEVKELQTEDIKADVHLFKEIQELQEFGLEIDYSAVSQVTNLGTGEITYTFFMNENKEGEVQNLILTFYGGIFHPRVLIYKFSEDQKAAITSKEVPKGGTDIELKDIITESVEQDVARDIEGRAPKRKLVAAITPTLTIWYDGGTLGTVYLESSPPESETSASAGGDGTIYWPSGSIGLGGNLNGGTIGSGIDGSMPSTNHSGGGGGPITTPILPKPVKGDPCKEAKKTVKNEEYAEAYEALTKKTSLPYESGFQMDWNGKIKDMKPVGRTSMSMDIGAVQTADHVHNDLPEEVGVSVKVPSPKDINMLFNLAKNAYHQNKDFNSVSIGTISSQGNYKIYFTGTENELKNLPYNAGGGGQDSLQKLNKVYADDYFDVEPNLTANQRDTLLLRFLEKEIGTSKIAAVRVDNNGNPIKTITVDKNGKITIKDC